MGPLRLLPLALGAGAFALACGSITLNATQGPDLGPDGGRLVDGSVLDGPAFQTDGGEAGFGDASFCSGSGPLVPVPGAPDSCLGDVANRTFLFAVCACNDLQISGQLQTDSLNSLTGATSQSGGSLGADGPIIINSGLDVQGDVWTSMTASGALPPALHTKQDAGTIAGDVHAGGDVEADQPLTVAGDMYVNGNVTGTIACGGSLYLPTGDTAPDVTADGGVTNEPVSVVAPCDCSNTLPIGSIVSAFASSNDDAVAGLTPTSLESATNPLTLGCGLYYFDAITGPSLTLTLTGRAAIFVAGDVAPKGPLSITLAPGAELDLFIAGNLALGDATIGDTTAPAETRVYVGGDTFTLSGTANMAANFYAPSAEVQLSSAFTMSGSLFVGRLLMSGAFTIHYDSSILETQGCENPVHSCSTCHDCSSAAPACIGGTCGPCQTDGDCCPPQSCRSGQCVQVLK